MAAGGDAMGLGYWWQWQVSACALVLTVTAAAATAAIARARPEPLRATDLWIPCWRRLSPLWLLAFRSLALLLSLSLLCHVVLLDGAFAFYFYTQWTFTFVIIYFLIATVISAHGCWVCSRSVLEMDETEKCLKRHMEDSRYTTLTSGKNRNWKATKLNCYKRGVNEPKAGFWGYIMQVAYQTGAGATVLTDIVFWGLLVPFLSPDDFRLDLVMGCMHTFNLLFLLLDTALNSLPFPCFRLAYFVLLSCMYVIFQWVLHAYGFSWWPYPFLELSSPWAPIWYLCLSLIHVPCYGLYSLVVNVKFSLSPKIFPNAYMPSGCY